MSNSCCLFLRVRKAKFSFTVCCLCVLDFLSLELTVTFKQGHKKVFKKIINLPLVL